MFIEEDFSVKKKELFIKVCLNNLISLLVLAAINACVIPLMILLFTPFELPFQINLSFIPDLPQQVDAMLLKGYFVFIIILILCLYYWCGRKFFLQINSCLLRFFSMIAMLIVSLGITFMQIRNGFDTSLPYFLSWLTIDSFPLLFLFNECGTYVFVSTHIIYRIIIYFALILGMETKQQKKEKESREDNPKTESMEPAEK